VHIGHSYGSLLSNALAASAPSLSDGVVLTGFSHTNTWQQWFLISTAYHLASLNQPSRFGKYSTGFLTWVDKFYNQFAFLTYPFFEPGLLDQAEASKWPFTLGEFITAGEVPVPAPSFTKPVLVCYAPSHGSLFRN
jgi:pimeloyl-ACP methyl ester carboxylesterase